MKIRVIVELEAEPEEAKQYADIVEEVVNDCLADRHWLKSYEITREEVHFKSSVKDYNSHPM